MFNLEQSITEWRNQMLASGIQSPVPLDELEGHLRDHIQQLESAGRPPAEAFSIAVMQIGDAPSLKREFTKVSRHRFAVWRDNPAALNLIGLWLIIVGINASCSVRIWFKSDVAAPRVMIFGIVVTLLLMLQSVTGIGLVLRSNFWRRFALCWSGLLLGLFTFGLVWHFITASDGASFTDSSLGLTEVGGQTNVIHYYFLRLPLPIPFLQIISVFNVAVLASSIYLLTRPSIRALFNGGRQAGKQLVTEN